MKRYLQFIKEMAEEYDDESNVANEPIEKTDGSKFDEVKEEIKSLIEKTVENSGGEFKTFVDSFNKTPEDFEIEGLINDSDVFDFYIKYRNDIDELLNDIKYFDEAPSEVNAFGLYEYIIKGTEKAVEEIVKTL